MIVDENTPEGTVFFVSPKVLSRMSEILEDGNFVPPKLVDIPGMWSPVLSKQVAMVRTKLGKWGRKKAWKTNRPGRKWQWGEYDY